MSPIILVTRDTTRDPLRVEWFENEAGYYAEDPLAWLEFDPVRDEWDAKRGRNARPETSLAAARLLLELVLDPQASVYQLATHWVSEPGAPLEPIVGTAPEVAA